MLKKKWAAIALGLTLLASIAGIFVQNARAGVVCSLPFNLQNGTTADATQVMANYNTLVTCLANAAAAGTNNDITSLLGLTTPLSFTEGGSSVYIGGTATFLSNVYTIPTTTPSGFTLTKGFIVSFIPPSPNTSSVQINVAGQGNVNFFRQTPSGPAAMVGGEIQTNQTTIAYYDGTQFQCISCAQLAQVPTGSTLDFSGVIVPTGFALANGQALSRTTFSVLWNTLAYTGISATATNTSTSVVVPNSALFQVGWYVGASANIPCNAFITSIPDGTHVVVSSAATSSGSPTISIGPYPQGDCSTTFNLPNYVGKFLAGVDGSTNITSVNNAIPITFTNGSPVISGPNNLVIGQALTLTTTGSLPTNFATSTTYYVITTGLSATQFELSATPGGTAITAGSAGSGSQTAQVPICANAGSIGDKASSGNLGCGSQARQQNFAQLPSSIPYTDPTHTHSYTSVTAGSGTIGGGGAFGGPLPNQTSGASATGITLNPNGGNTLPVLPPASLVYKIIKT